MQKHVKRFLKLPKNESVFLFGPRGTGKSTWLKRNLPQSLYIDLLSPETFRLLAAMPERLEEMISGTKSTTVVIDEVQKLPALLEVVHKLMETFPDLRFVLTGSSARKLKRAGVDMLAGRAIVKHCFPFMAAELKNDFKLNDALRFGTTPVVYTRTERNAALQSYIFTYVDQEVKQEGLVRNIGNFHRFLEALSFSHSSLLNTSEISRECEVPRKTVETYIQIIEDLLIGYRVPVFSKRAKRILIKQSKFYFIDQGVFFGLRPKGILDSTSELSGAALEGLVFQHLKSFISYFDVQLTLHFWRTKSGNEVDFILYGADGFFAIEVKNSNKVHKKDLSPLKSFLKDYPEASAKLIYRGKETLQIDGITCIPCENFLFSLNGPGALKS